MVLGWSGVKGVTYGNFTKGWSKSQERMV